MKTIDNLDVYNLSLKIGQDIWEIVLGWDYFSRNTIGNQIVRAADSVTANISEGYGRYHFKEEKQFLYYARGSLLETKAFIRISFNRKLFSSQQFEKLSEDTELLGKMLNGFINSLNHKYKK